MHTKELFDLHGKVAIVTGGGSGLGRQMASALAEMGADIVLCARNAERCAQTAAELAALGVRALGFRCDVTSPDDVRAMVERTKAELGRIDILVNNAGRAWVAPVATMAVEDWRRVLEVNLTGAFLCSQAAGNVMIAQGGGKIINIASVAGLGGATPEVLDAIAYNTSKTHQLHSRPRGEVGPAPHQRERHRARVVPEPHVERDRRALGRSARPHGPARPDRR